MRCKNCGWENPEGNTHCEKCNSPLENQTSPDFSLKGTVREVGSIEEEAPSTCPKCGYPLRNNSKVCPSCGHILSGEPSNDAEEKRTHKCPGCGSPVGANEKFCSNCGTPLHFGTINNWANPTKGVFCTLKPIAWENEGIDYQPVSYSGDSIVLNRANTDSNNNSITSKEQAVLSFDGENWFIENRSEMETTYIKVQKKTKLENGDVIILGNRMFEFKG